MISDAAAIAEQRQKLDTGEEELLPMDVIERIHLHSEHPIKVYREYRGLTADALATKAGISQAYLSQLENSARQGSPVTLNKIAKVLGVELGNLVQV